LVLLTDVDATYARAVIVDEVGFLGQIDELMGVGLQQPTRISRRFTVGEPIVLDFAKFLLLTPSLFVCLLIWRRKHAVADFAFEIRRIDEHVHVRIAGRYPQPVPTWNGSDRVLCAALCLL